jgi:pimeloyl-ACP methyl ester carboxylesterase
MNAPQTAAAAADIAELEASLPDWFSRAFMVPRSEGYAHSDGAQIHYFRWGDPSLPGIVLTHGFMAHARCWAFIAPLLAARYCLVSYDLSGMGESEWRQAYDVDVRAREARAVAVAAGLADDGRKPALVCHSYGGSVGIAAVAQDPDAWSCLVVCDMTMLAPGEASQFAEHRKERQARGARPHRVYPDFASARARFRLAPDQPCENDYLMEYMARHSLKAVEGGWVWKFDPAILGPSEERDADWWQSTAPRFASLRLPRAIIYGQQSNMFSPRAARFVRDQAEDFVPIVEVPDAHHHIMLDQPIAFATTIDALVQALTGG